MATKTKIPVYWEDTYKQSKENSQMVHFVSRNAGKRGKKVFPAITKNRGFRNGNVGSVAWLP